MMEDLGMYRVALTNTYFHGKGDRNLILAPQSLPILEEPLRPPLDY